MAPPLPMFLPSVGSEWPPSESVSASASAIVAGAPTGYHVLTIEGYSRTKLTIPNGVWIETQLFRVAGHTWSISYYPNGDQPDAADHISIYLALKDPFPSVVVVQFVFSFIDEVEQRVPSYIRTVEAIRFYSGDSWGSTKFERRTELEQSGRLKDDCFTIRCDINVLEEPRAKVTTLPRTSFVRVPPPDWPAHFDALLHGGKGADVRFLVGGEVFDAHRCVLAARSPVFDVLLFGPMKEGTSTQRCIRIDGMEPQVFQSLLHFIYTDSLPPETVGQGAAMSQHLLEAADRYGMQRLKLICEDMLCRNIDVSTVATTLALAEQNHCQGLKEACYEFLKYSRTLDAVRATDGFQHLARSCPSALFELMSKLAAR